jgi:hypothetical protein
MVFLGIAAALVVLVVGGIGLILAATAGDDDEAANRIETDASNSGALSDSSSGSDTSVEGQSAGLTTEPVSGSGDGSEQAGCTKVDDENIQIDLVNSTAETSTYSLTIAFIDDAGQRVGDTFAYVNALRPSERTVQTIYVFEDAAQATGCEVIDADRTVTELDPAAVGDVPSCDITGSDFIDDVAATLSATNSSSAESDYDIEVAIVDGERIRRGNGWAYIEHVRAGETAPSDVFTTVAYEDGLTCEVVSVVRRAST